MNVEQLAKALKLNLAGKGYKFNQEEARLILDSLDEVILEALKTNDKVKVGDTVTLHKTEVAEATRKNPQDQSDVVVPAHNRATAKVNPKLKKAVR